MDIVKDIGDFYITLSTIMSGLFIVSGAFIIFQYEHIRTQVTQSYDLFRKYLCKNKIVRKLKEYKWDKQEQIDDIEWLDEEYDLWLEKDIFPRFKILINLYEIKGKNKPFNRKDQPEIFALCDYYSTIKVLEDFKRKFKINFESILTLNGILLTATFSMVLFKSCFTLDVLSLATLGFLFLVAYAVYANIDCIFRGIGEVEFPKINNWDNTIVHSEKKYPEGNIKNILNKMK